MASPPLRCLGFGPHRRPAGADRSTDFPRARGRGTMKTGTALRWRQRCGCPTALIVPSAPPPRLLDRVRGAVRLRHLSCRTEKAYVGWIRRFILFHAKRHPIEMGPAEITRFLSAIATERNVSASTQKSSARGPSLPVPQRARPRRAVARRAGAREATHPAPRRALPRRSRRRDPR